MKQHVIDYNKELVHSFGDYVQATEDNSPKNNNFPRSLDCIYLRAADQLQGGHELIDLATGQKITRPKVTACRMTRMVIERVELIAARQGYRSLKFFNRKKQEMVLRDADLLAGVDGAPMVLEDGDDEYVPPLPPLVDEYGAAETSGDEDVGDVDLEVDEEITSDEVADLLQDAGDREVEVEASDDRDDEDPP